MNQLEITLIICTVFLVSLAIAMFYLYFTLKLKIPVLINEEEDKWQNQFKKLEDDWRKKQDEW